MKMSHVAYIRKQLNTIVVEAPYHRTWTRAIQTIIPRRDRVKRDGVWHFDINWHEAIYEITKYYYVHISCVKEPDVPSPDGWRKKWNSFLLEYAHRNHDNNEENTNYDFSTLYLLDDAPLGVVKAAYKALVMIHHPDRGGNTDIFMQIDEAYKRIMNAQGK